MLCIRSNSIVDEIINYKRALPNLHVQTDVNNKHMFITMTICNLGFHISLRCIEILKVVIIFQTKFASQMPIAILTAKPLSQSYNQEME